MAGACFAGDLTTARIFSDGMVLQRDMAVPVRGTERPATTLWFKQTPKGALVANNIFYIQGKTASVADDQETNFEGAQVKFKNVIFMNNLVTRPLPRNIFNQCVNPVTADPKFKNPGGFNPNDYIPANPDAVKGKGAPIAKLPGDPLGLTIGFQVETDFMGNKIPNGPPDLGAIICP